VVVTDDKVEIRYVLPTSPDGPHPPFCQLRKDHLDRPSGRIPLHQLGRGAFRSVETSAKSKPRWRRGSRTSTTWTGRVPWTWYHRQVMAVRVTMALLP
jgi:hypothetical protein